MKLVVRRHAPDRIKEYEQQYQDGLITQGEKYNKVVDAWSHCTDRVADEMMKDIATVRPRGRRQLRAELGLHDGSIPVRAVPPHRSNSLPACVA